MKVCLRFAVVALTLLLVGCPHTTRWLEEVALSDGRTVQATRTVVLAMTGGEPQNWFKRWPTKYSIKVSHPDNGKTIAWAGEDHIKPIMLDFVNGSAYLVVLPQGIRADMRPYGCPNPPYAVLRYVEADRSWSVIPRGSAPKVLRRANLSAEYDRFFLKGKKPQRTAEEVARANDRFEHITRHFFQVIFPDTVDAWRYPAKNDKTLNRYGCRDRK